MTTRGDNPWGRRRDLTFPRLKYEIPAQYLLVKVRGFSDTI
jgi:hypothetical protein